MRFLLKKRPKSVFERIGKVEKKVGSFVTLMKETKGAANPQLVNKLLKKKT